MATKINDLDHLRRLVKLNNQLEVFIVLAGGLARSSKTLTKVDDKHVDIFHDIDGSFQTLTYQKMLKDTNIGEALKVGALYAHDGQKA